VLRSAEGARVHVSIAEAGYARVALRVDLDWSLPAELSADRLSRSSAYVETRVSTVVSLAAGSPRVDITTEWENRSKDHRLRALFPLGGPVEASHTQGQFEVTRRPGGAEDPGRGWPELRAPTQPQQGWISVDNGQRGLLVANHGLPEVEVLPGGRGTIALTLLRAFGWVSRDDLLSRVGGAGPEVPAPDAQELGLNRVSYAIIPHEGSWLGSRAHRSAEDFLVPLYGSVGGVHPGSLPLDGGLVELSGDHTLLCSACKKAERRDALVLRCWNVAEQPTEARVRLARRPVAVRVVDLKEEPLESEPIEVDADGSFTLAAGPARIVTVAVSFG
jgi:mannosylglycerate hydrolase